jgi:hypothetical protein
MKYEIIFSNGYTDDEDSLMRGYRSDVLLLDEMQNYYNLEFEELEVIKNGFDKDQVCYTNGNLIILHEVTKENILKSIPKLHDWRFYERWLPLTKGQIEKYYYPAENWKIFTVEIPLVEVRSLS